MERRGSRDGSGERGDRQGAGARSGDAARRKPLPPVKTHAEEFYFLKQMNSRTPMLIVMVDGEELRGWIEWYDEACIKVHRHDGPNLMVYKRHIKYILKDPEAADPS